MSRIQFALVTMVLSVCCESLFAQSDEICPVQLMMNNSGYCMYYALDCPTTPYTLQFPCGSQLGCNNNPDCVDVFRLNDDATSSGLGGRRRAIQRQLGSQGNAGKNNMRHVWEPNPKLEFDKASLLKTSAVQFPYKNNSGKKIYAQLFFIYVPENTEAGREYPEGIVAGGHEIEKPPPEVPVTNLEPAQVQRLAERCHIVTLEGVPYIVTTFRGTDPDQ